MPLLYTPIAGKLYKAKKSMDLKNAGYIGHIDRGSLYMVTKYQPHGWKSTMSCNMAVDVSRILVWFLVGKQEFVLSFSVSKAKHYSYNFEDIFEEHKL